MSSETVTIVSIVVTIVSIILSWKSIYLKDNGKLKCMCVFSYACGEHETFAWKSSKSFMIGIAVFLAVVAYVNAANYFEVLRLYNTDYQMLSLLIADSLPLPILVMLVIPQFAKSRSDCVEKWLIKNSFCRPPAKMTFSFICRAVVYVTIFYVLFTQQSIAPVVISLQFVSIVQIAVDLFLLDYMRNHYMYLVTATQVKVPGYGPFSEVANYWSRGNEFSFTVSISGDVKVMTLPLSNLESVAETIDTSKSMACILYGEK